jgi:hypothetical protein
MVGGRGPASKLLCSSVRSEASASLIRHKIGTVPELPPWAQKARQVPRSAPTPRAGTRPSRGRKKPRWIDILDRRTRATVAFQALVRVFADLARHLACEDAPLPPSGETWTGRTRFKREFEEFCAIPPDISEADYRRRYRAFGEGPFKDLNVMLHGHRFAIENPWTDADLAREMGTGG